MRNRITVPILILLLISSFGLAQDAEDLRQLETGPQTPSYEKEVEVRLQLLDVTVEDQEGNYVTSLTRDDFIVRVDGEEVPIRTFDVYYSGKAGGIEDMASGMIPETASPTRKLVLFFDHAYSSYQGFRSAKNASLEFVKRNLKPGDEVMIVSYDHSFKIHTEFTRDREKMAEAIEDMSYGMRGGMRRSSTFPSENEFNVRVYLEALTDLALYLDAWRGRKTFIMLSEGFAQPIAIYGLSAYLEEALEQFRDSNLTIFPVDVAGLGRGAAASPRLASMRRDTLASFAIETGGEFYRGSNDIERLLLNVDEDISNYYVLGISVPAEQDGRYRDVEIEAKSGDYRLTHSPGFFAPKKFDDMGSKEKAVHLAEGFNLPTPIREFPADFHAGVFPRNDGSAVAGVVIQAPIRSDQEQRFEVRGTVTGPDGELVDAFHRRMEFSTGDDEFYHEEYLNMEPGENLLRLVIRDNNTGERCYHFMRAKMPLIDEGLYASTILFTQPESRMDDVYRSTKARSRSQREEFDLDVSQPANPLSIISQSILLVPDNVAPQAAGQGAIIKVSGVMDRKQPNLDVKMTARTRTGDRYPVPVTDMNVRSIPGTGEAVLVLTLDFSEIEAGDYWLSAEITDLDADKLVGQQTRIQIVKP